MLYAEIILPVPGECYTFSVDDNLASRVMVGSAVSVQFGKGGRKIVGGIVRHLHSDTPHYKNIKPVLALLLPEPIVSGVQMRLWEWISEYYMCSLGEVMRAALPAMLKPSGLSPEEFSANVFSARKVRFVALAEAISSDEILNEICEKLTRRSPKQYEALVEIAGRIVWPETVSDAEPKPVPDAGSGSARSTGNVPPASGGVHREIPREVLRADAAALKALQKKGIIVFSERDVTYSDTSYGDECRAAGHPGSSVFTEGRNLPEPRLPDLSPAQQKALAGISTSLRSHEVALLFGVPSSGKSEVAFHAMASTLAAGRDVLLLLPEISLTTQFVRRVRAVFGERVVLYHSGLTDRRRAEAYLRLARSEGASLVVGTRSSVFLPMRHLGLVVVDEEQDTSYKQQDPAPRYNARDVAIMLARLSGGTGDGDSNSESKRHESGSTKVLLASATPSLETWANAMTGKYGLVELSERYGGSLPPEVIVSDTVRSVKRGERRSHFNKELLDRMSRVLESGGQTILFQNRRGMAPFVECPDCGLVPRCDHCGIPMTAHRRSLRCHYCGASSELPSVCPSCGSMNIAARGFGTEKIEEELARLFPSARIARLDADSAGSEKAYARIISDFENGATDILVGTQMVTKGLDFAGVSLVGVLNADNLMNHPDFRASERAYQLLAQVAGRAGRRDTRGEVVIQTASPESSLIARASAGDYRAMASEMLAERAVYGYPPYARLVSVMLRHPSREVLDAAASRFGEVVEPAFGELLLGPEPPVVERIKGEFALVFLLKVPRSGLSMSQMRNILHEANRTLLSDPAFRGVSITPNVDPQ